MAATAKEIIAGILDLMIVATAEDADDIIEALEQNGYKIVKITRTERKPFVIED